MEGGKKVVAVVVLLIVIVGAVALLMKNRASRSGPPSGVLGEAVEMIDKETSELITRSVGEWQNGGKENETYKNPKTGKFTMVGPMICGSCGAKIPPPDVPKDANQEEIMRINREYMCPKCHQSAYGPDRPPG